MNCKENIGVDKDEFALSCRLRKFQNRIEHQKRMEEEYLKREAEIKLIENEERRERYLRELRRWFEELFGDEDFNPIIP